MDLRKYIDHTILKPSASKQDIEQICKEALEYGFASVCVNPCNIKQVSELLSGSDVKVCSVVGFPHGQNLPEVKAYETELACRDGADEIDMVINYARLIDGEYDYIYDEISEVRSKCEGAVLKVILECSELNDEEIKKACEICEKAGADFVKTSTGFSSGGAEIEDVRLMSDSCSLKIKASGGIRTTKKALNMIEAGANRIGASAGISIVKGSDF